MVLINMLGQFSGILCALLAYGLAYIDGRGGLVRPYLSLLISLTFLIIPLTVGLAVGIYHWYDNFVSLPSLIFTL